MKKNFCLFAKVCTFIFVVSFSLSHMALAEIIYELHNEIACCKENCVHSGIKNCREKDEIEVTKLQIKDTKKITIKGRGAANASTCFSAGEFTAEFTKNDGKILPPKKVNIPCKSTKNINMSFDFEKLQSGELILYLNTSDWCTTLRKMTVSTSN
jgi:hypothetical protein